MFLIGAILGVLVLVLLIWFVSRLIDLDDLYDRESNHESSTGSWKVVSYHDDENDEDDDDEDDRDTDPGVSYSSSDDDDDDSSDEGFGGGDSGGGGASSDW